MSDKPWKKFERDIAAIFGTTRALMKGTNEVKDIGPEDDFPLVLDCKLWKAVNWKIPSWFKKLQRSAGYFARGGFTQKYDLPPERWPVLCIREPGKHMRYCLVDRVSIMKFIAEKTCPPLGAPDFFHWEAKGFGPEALIKTWKLMARAKSDHNRLYASKISDNCIRMVSMKKKEDGMELTAFTPEDLARLFRIGGVLKDG